MRRPVVIAALLLACSAIDVAAARADGCTKDGDCRVIAPTPCCSLCAGEPQAVSRTWRPPACGCALEDPPARGCPSVTPVGRFTATCRAGSCVLVSRRALPPPRAPKSRPRVPEPHLPSDTPPARTSDSCDRDTECRIDTFSGCCNPCPGAPRAVRVDHPGIPCACAPLHHPLEPSSRERPCPPVPSSAKLRAACRQHTCRLVPR